MDNNFKIAVNSTEEIAYGYMTGLKALNSNASKVCVSDSRKIQGSVDIDKYTKKLYPEDNRWDYALGYNNKVYFIEVHPAHTSEVQVVLKKLEWLKSWLNSKGHKLNALPKGEPTFTWIQSGKGAIIPTSKSYKQAAIKGIIPKSKLEIK